MAEVKELDFSDAQIKKLKSNLKSIGVGVGIDTVKNDCRIGKFKGMGDDILGEKMRLVLLSFKEFQSARPLFPQKDAIAARKSSITSIHQYTSLMFLNIDTLRVCSMLMKTYGNTEFWRSVRTLADFAQKESSLNLNTNNTVFECSFRSKSNKEKHDGLVPQFNFGKIADEYTSSVIASDGKFKAIAVERLPKNIVDTIGEWRTENEYCLFDKNVFMEYARINRPDEFQRLDDAYDANPEIVQRLIIKASMEFYGHVAPNIQVAPLFDFEQLGSPNILPTVK